MRKTLFGLVALVALTLSMTPSAGAHPTEWSDPDQTEEVDREMEIRSVIQRHPKRTLPYTSDPARFLSFDVRTFEEFDNSRLDSDQTEHLALMIGLDLDDRRDFDRMVHVDADADASGDHVLYGVLTAGKERFDPDDEGRWVPMRRILGYVRVTRPAPDTVRVSFPVSALRYRGLDEFKWMVRVVYGNRAGSEECGCTNNSFDYAPPNRMRRGHV